MNPALFLRLRHYIAVVLRRVLCSPHVLSHDFARVLSARVRRATVALPGGAAANPTLRVRNAAGATVEMLASHQHACSATTEGADLSDSADGSSPGRAAAQARHLVPAMPHTWVEVSLSADGEQTQWWQRKPTELGVDVTATQFDVREYYASAPLAIWPASAPPFELLAPLPVGLRNRL